MGSGLDDWIYWHFDYNDNKLLQFAINRDRRGLSSICFKFYDWRQSQSYVLVSCAHLGLRTRYLLLSVICGFVDVGRSLSDERTGLPFTIAAGLASAVILGSESRGTRDNILLPQIRDSPNLEGQVPVFITPRNRVAQLYPQALGSLFVASYDSQGYVKVKVTLWLTVSQTISHGVEPHLGSWPDIYYFLTVTVLFLWGAMSKQHVLPITACLNSITLTTLRDICKQRSFSLCNILNCLLTLYFVRPNIFFLESRSDDNSV
jgi:hypothetical protein